MLLPKTINTFGIWTQFTGYFFQEPHDILLKDGAILKSVVPNEEGWELKGDDGRSWEYVYNYYSKNNLYYIANEDIVAIRLLTDEDIKVRNIKWEVGQKRINNINDHFADGREHVLLDRNHLIKDNQLAVFVNDIRSIAIKYGATQQLREHIGRRVKKLLTNLTYVR